MFMVCITSLSHGAAVGWLSPALLILQSPDSPLESGPITVDEASWLGSIFALGAICGNIISGIIANSWGRKIGLCCLALPELIFWLLIIFGYNIYFLYVGRFFAGIESGGLFVGIPVFISEISDKRIRARLGSFLFFSKNSGVLIGYLIGANLPYSVVPKVLIVLPVVFLMIVAFFPETPQFLLTKGEDKNAMKSLAFYRNLKMDVHEDQLKLNEMFNEMNDNISDTAGRTKLSFSDFKNKDNIKLIFQGFGVAALHMLGGTFIVVNYAASIFKHTGADLDPNTSAIIIPVSLILGTYLSTLIADRFTRKTMVFVSAAGAAISYFGAGFVTLLSQKYDLSEVHWTPVLCISLAVFSSSTGYIPLTFVIISELLPQKLRALGATFCNVFLNIVSFCMLKAVPLLMLQIGVHGVVFIFGGICILGIPYFIICMPETKGKLI